MPVLSYCRGCGAPLQTREPNKPGYIPAQVLARDEGELRCQACYRLLHYGYLEDVIVTRQDYLRAIERGIREADLVVQVFDIIDFEGSWSDEINDLIGKKPLIVAVTKMDLLPQQVKPREVERWVSGRLRELDRKEAVIVLLSSRKGWGTRKLRERIRQLGGKDCRAALVGATNVGKSSLLNSLQYRGSSFKGSRPGGSTSSLTTSPYPGTTQGVVRVDLVEEGMLILDTPGLSQPGRVTDTLCRQCSSRLIPAKELSRKTFKMNQGRTLMFGTLARFNLVGGHERPVLVAFAARDVLFHETRGERVLELLANHQGERLFPPCPACVPEGWERISVTVEEGQDVVIPGLGWVSVRRGPVELDIRVPPGIKVVTRQALISPVPSRSS